MGQSKPIGSNTILIVEDEAIIRFELIDLFEEEGYRVFAAADADEAIAILDRHGEVRVVLTDIEMPGSMDGLKLAHYIRNRYPPTLLLVASDRVSVPASEMPEHSAYLAKPFDPAAMLRKIDEMTR
jgi:CheY-like chemotaxis protein